MQMENKSKTLIAFRQYIYLFIRSIFISFGRVEFLLLLAYAIVRARNTAIAFFINAERQETGVEPRQQRPIPLSIRTGLAGGCHCQLPISEK